MWKWEPFWGDIIISHPFPGQRDQRAGSQLKIKCEPKKNSFFQNLWWLWKENGLSQEAVLFTVCHTHQDNKLWKGQPPWTNRSPSRANNFFGKRGVFWLTLYLTFQWLIHNNGWKCYRFESGWRTWILTMTENWAMTSLKRPYYS